MDYSKIDIFITTSDLSSKNIDEFKKLLREVNWTNVTTMHNVNHAYNRFLETFTGLYEIAFPKRKPRIKQRTLNRPWMKKVYKNHLKRNKKKMYMINT